MSLSSDLLKTSFMLSSFVWLINCRYPMFIPGARLEYVFDSDDIVNFDKGYVNRYIAPDLLKSIVPDGHRAKLPMYIEKLIDHVLAHDAEVKERFYNDLAYLIQKRKKLITSYLFQGVEGTGKGFSL